MRIEKGGEPIPMREHKPEWGWVRSGTEIDILRESWSRTVILAVLYHDWDDGKWVSRILPPVFLSFSSFGKSDTRKAEVDRGG